MEDKAFFKRAFDKVHNIDENDGNSDFQKEPVFEEQSNMERSISYLTERTNLIKKCSNIDELIFSIYCKRENIAGLGLDWIQLWMITNTNNQEMYSLDPNGKKVILPCFTHISNTSIITNEDISKCPEGFILSINTILGKNENKGEDDITLKIWDHYWHRIIAFPIKHEDNNKNDINVDKIYGYLLVAERHDDYSLSLKMRELLAKQCTQTAALAVGMQLHSLNLANKWHIAELECEVQRCHSGVLEHVDKCLHMSRLCGDDNKYSSTNSSNTTIINTNNHEQGIRGMFQRLLYDTTTLMTFGKLQPLVSVIVVECTHGPYSFCSLQTDGTLEVIPHLGPVTERVLQGSTNLIRSNNYSGSDSGGSSIGGQHVPYPYIEHIKGNLLKCCGFHGDDLGKSFSPYAEFTIVSIPLCCAVDPRTSNSGIGLNVDGLRRASMVVVFRSLKGGTGNSDDEMLQRLILARAYRAHQSIGTALTIMYQRHFQSISAIKNELHSFIDETQNDCISPTERVHSLLSAITTVDFARRLGARRCSMLVGQKLVCLQRYADQACKWQFNTDPECRVTDPKEEMSDASKSCPLWLYSNRAAQFAPLIDTDVDEAWTMNVTSDGDHNNAMHTYISKLISHGRPHCVVIGETGVDNRCSRRGNTNFNSTMTPEEVIIRAIDRHATSAILVPIVLGHDNAILVLVDRLYTHKFTPGGDRHAISNGILLSGCFSPFDEEDVHEFQVQHMMEHNLKIALTGLKTFKTQRQNRERVAHILKVAAKSRNRNIKSMVLTRWRLGIKKLSVEERTGANEITTTHLRRMVVSLFRRLAGQWNKQEFFASLQHEAQTLFPSSDVEVIIGDFQKKLGGVSKDSESPLYTGVPGYKNVLRYTPLSISTQTRSPLAEIKSHVGNSDDAIRAGMMTGMNRRPNCIVGLIQPHKEENQREYEFDSNQMIVPLPQVIPSFGYIMVTRQPSASIPFGKVFSEVELESLQTITEIASAIHSLLADNLARTMLPLLSDVLPLLRSNNGERQPRYAFGKCVDWIKAICGADSSLMRLSGANSKEQIVITADDIPNVTNSAAQSHHKQRVECLVKETTRSSDITRIVMKLGSREFATGLGEIVVVGTPEVPLGPEHRAVVRLIGYIVAESFADASYFESVQKEKVMALHKWTAAEESLKLCRSSEQEHRIRQTGQRRFGAFLQEVMSTNTLYGAARSVVESFPAVLDCQSAILLLRRDRVSQRSSSNDNDKINEYLSAITKTNDDTSTPIASQVMYDLVPHEVNSAVIRFSLSSESCYSLEDLSGLPDVLASRMGQQSKILLMERGEYLPFGAVICFHGSRPKDIDVVWGRDDDSAILQNCLSGAILSSIRNAEISTIDSQVNDLKQTVSLKQNSLEVVQGELVKIKAERGWAEASAKAAHEYANDLERKVNMSEKEHEESLHHAEVLRHESTILREGAMMQMKQALDRARSKCEEAMKQATFDRNRCLALRELVRGFAVDTTNTRILDWLRVTGETHGCALSLVERDSSGQLRCGSGAALRGILSACGEAIRTGVSICTRARLDGYAKSTDHGNNNSVVVAAGEQNRGEYAPILAVFIVPNRSLISNNSSAAACFLFTKRPLSQSQSHNEREGGIETTDWDELDRERLDVAVSLVSRVVGRIPVGMEANFSIHRSGIKFQSKSKTKNDDRIGYTKHIGEMQSDVLDLREYEIMLSEERAIAAGLRACITAAHEVWTEASATINMSTSAASKDPREIQMVREKAICSSLGRALAKLLIRGSADICNICARVCFGWPVVSESAGGEGEEGMPNAVPGSCVVLLRGSKLLIRLAHTFGGPLATIALERLLKADLSLTDATKQYVYHTEKTTGVQTIFISDREAQIVTEFLKLIAPMLEAAVEVKEARRLSQEAGDVVLAVRHGVSLADSRATRELGARIVMDATIRRSQELLQWAMRRTININININSDDESIDYKGGDKRDALDILEPLRLHTMSVLETIECVVLVKSSSSETNSSNRNIKGERCMVLGGELAPGTGGLNTWRQIHLESGDVEALALRSRDAVFGCCNKGEDADANSNASFQFEVQPDIESWLARRVKTDRGILRSKGVHVLAMPLTLMNSRLPSNLSSKLDSYIEPLDVVKVQQACVVCARADRPFDLLDRDCLQWLCTLAGYIQNNIADGSGTSPSHLLTTVEEITKVARKHEETSLHEQRQDLKQKMEHILEEEHKVKEQLINETKRLDDIIKEGRKVEEDLKEQLSVSHEETVSTQAEVKKLSEQMSEKQQDLMNLHLKVDEKNEHETRLLSSIDSLEQQLQYWRTVSRALNGACMQLYIAEEDEIPDMNDNAGLGDNGIDGGGIFHQSTVRFASPANDETTTTANRNVKPLLHRFWSQASSSLLSLLREDISVERCGLILSRKAIHGDDNNLCFSPLRTAASHAHTPGVSGVLFEWQREKEAQIDELCELVVSESQSPTRSNSGEDIVTDSMHNAMMDQKHVQIQTSTPSLGRSKGYVASHTPVLSRSRSHGGTGREEQIKSIYETPDSVSIEYPQGNIIVAGVDSFIAASVKEYINGSHPLSVPKTDGNIWLIPIHTASQLLGVLSIHAAKSVSFQSKETMVETEMMRNAHRACQKAVVFADLLSLTLGGCLVRTALSQQARNRQLQAQRVLASKSHECEDLKEAYENMRYDAQANNEAMHRFETLSNQMTSRIEELQDQLSQNESSREHLQSLISEESLHVDSLSTKLETTEAMNRNLSRELAQVRWRLITYILQVNMMRENNDNDNLLKVSEKELQVSPVVSSIGIGTDLPLSNQEEDTSKDTSKTLEQYKRADRIKRVHRVVLREALSLLDPPVLLRTPHEYSYLRDRNLGREVQSHSLMHIQNEEWTSAFTLEQFARTEVLAHPALLAPAAGLQDISHKLLSITRSLLRAEGVALFLRDDTVLHEGTENNGNNGYNTNLVEKIDKNDVDYYEDDVVRRDAMLSVTYTGNCIRWPGLRPGDMGSVMLPIADEASTLSLVGHTLQSRQTIVLADITADQRYDSSIDGLCASGSSAILVPLRGNTGTAIGVIMALKPGSSSTQGNNSNGNTTSSLFSTEDTVAAELVAALGSIGLYWCVGIRPLHNQILRGHVQGGQLRDTLQGLTGTPQQTHKLTSNSQVVRSQPSPPRTRTPPPRSHPHTPPRSLSGKLNDSR